MSITNEDCVSAGLFSNNFMQMKKIITAFFGICVLLSLQSCNRHLQKDTVPAVFTELPEPDEQYQYIKNYFILF